jgi:hypothetical protein
MPEMSSAQAVISGPHRNPRPHDNLPVKLDDTCGRSRLGYTIRRVLGRSLWRQNIDNMDIRIAITSREKVAEKSQAELHRRNGITVLGRGPSICPVLARFRGVRSAVRCCRGCRPRGNVRSVASNCIRASSAPISIPGAALNACSLSRSESPRRMREMTALCLRFG